MKMIRPASDLQNDFTDISKIVHETAQPIFLTPNGKVDMVVLNMEAYENLQSDSEVYCKLQQVEQEALCNGRHHSSEEVLAAMKNAIGWDRQERCGYMDIANAMQYFINEKGARLHGRYQHEHSS